jgi:hypothetical protein
MYYSSFYFFIQQINLLFAIYSGLFIFLLIIVTLLKVYLDPSKQGFNSYNFQRLKIHVKPSTNKPPVNQNYL